MRGCVMLELKHIVKVYGEGENAVEALKGIDLAFRDAEFVSVLGPSGCGTTTLLNIVGGLDRSTEGDLLINGISTREYRASDWDAYRNHSVGFVFQSYNLIPHLTVLGNVELALRLSGIPPAERRRRAAEVLGKVGLSAQLKKRPNQLSGGQMQRVAIARALVNDPDILLADEPTGALDSGTSVQIMALLQEISRERLVIMVTHNGELAEQYSTRIVRLLDGRVVDDTRPCPAAEAAPAESAQPTEIAESAEPAAPADSGDPGKKGRRHAKRKTAMSFSAALNLSFNNLVMKKGRTFLTSFAGSIGIIGVALVLALTNGFSAYLARMQTDTLAGYPITINRTATLADLQYFMNNSPDYDEFPDGDVIYPYDESSMATDPHTNVISEEFLRYVEGIDPELTTSVAYYRSVRMHVLVQRSENDYDYLSTGTSYNTMTGANYSVWQEIFDPELVYDQFDVLEGGRLPENEREIVLVVDKYNRLSASFLEELGIETEEGETLSFSDFLGMEMKLVLNNTYYVFSETEGAAGEYLVDREYKKIYQTQSDEVIPLTVVGILRQKPDTQSAVLDSGFAFTPELLDLVLADAKNSDASQAQLKAGEGNIVVEDEKNRGYAYQQVLQHLGLDDTPASIRIYPKDFRAKQQICDYLDAWNEGKSEEEQIRYSDLAEVMTSTMGSVVNIISYVLVAFAAIALVVSSLMIGIITYTSVIERTKEIGVLRSIGARKKDVSRVFNAETLVIGSIAGVIGVALAALLTIPMNWIIEGLTGFSGITALNPLHAVLLVGVSMVLTLIAGLIPSFAAAKKDPVVALRAE